MTQIILLVTRPNYDYTTRYISTWAEKVIEWAKVRGHIILDLEEDRACRKDFESMIKKHSPSLLFLNGHGDDNMVTGQNNDIVLRVGQNETVLKNTITYALSCRSAKVLGAQSIAYGARAYIGYQEDFIFMYTNEKRTRPYEDRTADLFLEPSNQVVVSLLKGHTVHNAHLNARKAFFRNIQELLTSEASKEGSASVRYLLWDMQNLVYHGDGKATLQ